MYLEYYPYEPLLFQSAGVPQQQLQCLPHPSTILFRIGHGQVIKVFIHLGNHQAIMDIAYNMYM